MYEGFRAVLGTRHSFNSCYYCHSMGRKWEWEVGRQEESVVESNVRARRGSSPIDAGEVGDVGPNSGHGWPREEASCVHSGWQVWLEEVGLPVETVG